MVATLRAAGHEVYDFRQPKEGRNGFAWADIDPEWQRWSVDAFRAVLDHPIAQAGFELDRDALNRADTGVLVMPCGRPAHLELGYLAGQGKPCAVLACDPMEPELMVKLASGGVLTSLDELLQWIGVPSQVESGGGA